MKQSTITNFLKKEVQPTVHPTVDHYFKKEIDIDWDEADNCYGETCNNVQIQYTARVVLEKLSGSVLQKYDDKKNVTIAETPGFSEKCPRCKKNFKNKNSLNTHMIYCGKERDLQCAYCPYKSKHKTSLIVHLSKIHRNGTKFYQNKHGGDGKMSRICKKCNKISEAICPTKCEKCFSELLYQCKKCAKQFKTSSLANYHWSTRCGVKGYFNCIKCDFKSVWRSKVVQHMKLMHKSLDSCRQSENIEWTSLNHGVAKAESNTYKCPKCDKTMGNCDLLARHIRICGGIKREKTSGIESESDNDDRQNVESEPIKCSSCGKRFNHIYSLNVHIRSCKKEFVTRITNDSDVEVVETDEDNSLESFVSADKRHARYIKMIARYCSKCHEESSIEEKNRGFGRKMTCPKCKTILLLKCKKCLKEYTKYKSIQNHLDTVCNPKEEFKCTKCSYKAHKPGLVKVHYDSVHGTANAECKKCGSKFKSTYYLQRHLRRCGVEPKFQCEHCPFKSKLKIYLRNHIFRSHMEPVVVDRKDMIKISRQRFTRAASHLTAHCSKCKNEQRLGQRLKTCKKCKTKLYYECKACETKYDVDDENACNHVKAYLETIKYECKRCGRGAISEKSLWMHEHTCGSDVTFKCRFCKLTSKIKGNVTKHEKVKHPHKFAI